MFKNILWQGRSLIIFPSFSFSLLLNLVCTWEMDSSLGKMIMMFFADEGKKMGNNFSDLTDISLV